MNVEDALKHGFNKVTCNKFQKHAKSNTGVIKVIKPNGIAVDFGAGWNFWFWEEEQDDKRSKYMSSLTILTNH